MGLGQMIGGVCRFLGPLIVPVVYSWSCRPHKWIDSGFCFYVPIQHSIWWIDIRNLWNVVQCFSDLDFGRNKYDERIVKEVIGWIYTSIHTSIYAYYLVKSKWYKCLLKERGNKRWILNNRFHNLPVTKMSLLDGSNAIPFNTASILSFSELGSFTQPIRSDKSIHSITFPSPQSIIATLLLNQTFANILFSIISNSFKFGTLSPFSSTIHFRSNSLRDIVSQMCKLHEPSETTMTSLLFSKPEAAPHPSLRLVSNENDAIWRNLFSFNSYRIPICSLQVRAISWSFIRAIPSPKR